MKYKWIFHLKLIIYSSSCGSKPFFLNTFEEGWVKDYLFFIVGWNETTATCNKTETTFRFHTQYYVFLSGCWHSLTVCVCELMNAGLYSSHAVEYSQLPPFNLRWRKKENKVSHVLCDSSVLLQMKAVEVCLMALGFGSLKKKILLCMLWSILIYFMLLLNLTGVILLKTS